MHHALDQQPGLPETSEHPRRSLGDALDVFPVALGTNTFGWTADRDTAHEILDAYAGGGGNVLDTADMYPHWAEGCTGGESESIIGEWLRLGRAPQDLVIATKIGAHPTLAGLDAATVRAATDASLTRLGVERLDLLYAHVDDSETPLEETVSAMSGLVDAGKVRYLGLSNFTPERVRAWLEVADRGGFHRPVAIQPPYNLMERGIEEALLPVARESGLGVVPYFALAQGFLTGKYRDDGDAVPSPRAGAASTYLTPRGRRVLAALDGISGRLDVNPGTVALRWLLAQPGVVAPIASTRTASQVPMLLDAARIQLDPSEVEELERASTPRAGDDEA